MNIRSSLKWLLSSFLLVLTTHLMALTCTLPQWTEYPFDPIYNPGSASYPSVIHNANKFNDNSAFYKMWYQASNSLSFVYSNDGINWTNQPLTGLPLGAARPMVIYDPNGFGGGGFNYRMWFWDTTAPQTSISAIKFSMSTDGVNWVAPIPINQNPAFPLVDGITPGYFFHLQGPGYILYNPSAVPLLTVPTSFPYVMFYNTSSEGLGPGMSIAQIALAYSMDGLLWTRYGFKPVLIPSGNSNDWDGAYIYQSSIVQVEGIFHMFYSGANGLPLGITGNTSAHGIGHACSLDGINWVKDVTNPIFYVNDGVPWRNNQTFTPFVLFSPFCSCGGSPNSVAKMWFTGGNALGVTAIGYATMPCPVFFPEPPTNFQAIIKKNKFLNKTEYILQISWKASPTLSVTSYRIYNGNEIIEQIAATSPLVSTICLPSKNSINNFSITAVGCSNLESVHVPLVILNE